MILNNEKMYNTSEKSARYTKMQPSKEVRGLCDGYYDEEVGVVDEPNMGIHFF